MTPRGPQPPMLRRAAATLRRTLAPAASPTTSVDNRRWKTTSAQYVAARYRDHTFEKLMEGYKRLLQVFSVQDLILASPDLSVPLTLLSSPAVSRLLRFRRGPAHFLRSFPAVFSLHPSLPVLVRLTPAAARLARLESLAATASAAADRLARLLLLSPSRSFPLRAVFRIWRELGLPDDFEDSVIADNPSLFSLTANPREPNTHMLVLTGPAPAVSVFPAVEGWRRGRLSNQNSDAEAELYFGFKQSFPPGMRLMKGFRARLREWQRLPYTGPYDPPPTGAGRRSMEKRAVAIVHEFLSLTVEKMVEVEKISHFRKWFAIDLNIRDLFLDHPGMFYLSTKGRRHTVFLREAYYGGCLIEPNPIYEARRKLLHLVQMRKKGAAFAASGEDGAPTDSSDP